MTNPDSLNKPAGLTTAEYRARKRFGFYTTTALVIGNIIGAAIFMQPASLAPYGWNAVTAWMVVLAGSLCLAWVFAMLAKHHPDAGGAHGYMQMGVGERTAFLGSWGYLVSVWVANAAITITGVSYLTRLVPALTTIPFGEPGAALLTIVLLTWANARAMGGNVQVVSTVVKVLPFAAVIALAAYTLLRDGTAALAPVDAVPITAATTVSALGITFYAMLGLESAAMPADAVEDAEHVVPRATMVGTTLSGLITIVSSCAVALMLPVEVVVNSKAPVADFIGGYWGNWASLFVAFCGVVSCFGCLNGWLLIGGELPAAMCQRGSLPPWFGELNSAGVPARALVLGSTISGIFTLLASSRAGVAAFNFAALIATATNLVLYLLCAITALRFVADGRLPRRASILVAGAGAVIFALYAFYGSGWEALAWGAGLIAAGWPLYLVSQRLARRAAAAVVSGVIAALLLGGAAVLALRDAGAQAPAARQVPRQTEGDAYTRYELLAPGTGKFRIVYEVTATTPGATHYYNPIRPGSVASDESVTDRATGRALPFREVGGAVARTNGLPGADTSGRYIEVTLARPVPAEGEARVLIDKTYYDTASYKVRGDTIVFTRSLGIKRNAVFLPAGYELAESNFPAQVLQEPDGRIGVSFWNSTPSAAPLTLRAVPRRGTMKAASSVAQRLGERARQDREITYFLQQPETGAFDLFHDYTETMAGKDVYLNVVRPGSTVANPHGRVLDTGDTLRWEILRGEEIRRAGFAAPGADVRNTEIVVFRFPPVPDRGSTRIRMYETYTDTARYKLVDGELVWDRSFGRPINTVVLPAGWVLTNSSIPATVRTRADGRVELEFINPRPDEIQVLITARRR